MSLTPIEESSGRTGRRKFVTSSEFYVYFSNEVDKINGYPLGANSAAVTRTALPPIESLTIVNGNVTVSIECNRISPEMNDGPLKDAIDSGHIKEVLSD